MRMSPGSRRTSERSCEQMCKPNRKRIISSAVVSAALAAIGAQAAYATSGTWSGAAADGLWQTPGNWDNLPGTNNGVAGTSADVATFSGNPTSIAVTIDASRNIGGITFDSTTSTFTIGTTSGNTLFLTNGGTIAVTNAVTPPGGTVAVSPSVLAPLVLNGGTYNLRNDS